jgi:hypothetical protein
MQSDREQIRIPRFGVAATADPHIWRVGPLLARLIAKAKPGTLLRFEIQVNAAAQRHRRSHGIPSQHSLPCARNLLCSQRP